MTVKETATKKQRRRRKCRVRDGRFVVPCTNLQDLICDQNPPKNRKGVVSWWLINIKTGKEARSYVGVKSGTHSEKGVAFNFCPICGENISAPFSKEQGS